MHESIALVHFRENIMAFKPGPKPIADSTGKPDQRRRDNKSKPGNTPDLSLANPQKNIIECY